MENKNMEQKKVQFLFVCVENARRSQMAQGFAESLGQGRVEVYSAGSRPASQVDPLIIEVMKEKGIDLSSRHPKGLNDLPPGEMDYLVTMGCEESCPAILSKRVIEWDIPDPKGKPVDVYRKVRDFIEKKVKALLQDVG
jgi:protein-tyrosine-phosphatase